METLLILTTTVNVLLCIRVANTVTNICLERERLLMSKARDASVNTLKNCLALIAVCRDYAIRLGDKEEAAYYEDKMATGLELLEESKKSGY